MFKLTIKYSFTNWKTFIADVSNIKSKGEIKL